MNLSRLKYVWLILPFLAMGCEDDDVNADRMALSHKTYGFPVNGGEFTMVVSSTVPYSVTSEGGWLVMTGEADNRYSYKADENTSYDIRTAWILVKAGNKPVADTVHVYQVGKEGLFLDEAERSKSIGLEGGEIEVNVNFTNAAFRIKPEVEWITAVTTKATGLEQGTITLRVEANPDYSERSGKVVIASKDGLFTDTVTITQSQKLGVLLDKKSFSVVSEGEILTVGYRQNVGKATFVIPSEYQGWISEVPGTKGLSRDTLYLKIEANEVQDERIALIPIKLEQYTDTLMVTQKGALIAKNPDGTYTVFEGALFEDVLAKAKEGDTFKFMSGTYGKAGTDYKLPCGIIFEAVENQTPVLTAKQFSFGGLSANVGTIKFKGMQINCAAYIFDHNVDYDIENIILEDCDFVNCTAIASVLRIRKQTSGVKNIIVDNCTFDAFNNVKQHVISGDNGFPVNVTITNSTFAQIKAGNVINYGKQPADGVSVIIRNNTFAALNASGKYVLRPEKDFTNAVVEIENNIFMVVDYKGITNKVQGTVRVKNNCVPVAFAGDWSAIDDITDDPQFKDAANNDFTIQNDVVKTAGVGDPRWLK